MESMLLYCQGLFNPVEETSVLEQQDICRGIQKHE